MDVPPGKTGTRDGAFGVEIRQRSPGTWGERKRLWLQPVSDRADGSLGGWWGRQPS